MVVTRFEDLTIWQSARAFNRKVYKVSGNGRFARDYAMVDQIRRASLSVMNNIAEGFEKYRRNEFLNYLSHSKGSAGEVISMLYAALDVEYLTEKAFEDLLKEAEDLGNAIGKFRSGLERSKPKDLTPRRAPKHK